MSGNSLKLKVTSRKEGTSQYYEGQVTLTGLRPTKLTKNDGSTQYVTKSGVTQAAQSLAKKLGCKFVGEEQPVKKAAKKSTKKTSSKKTASSTPNPIISPPWLS